MYRFLLLFLCFHTAFAEEPPRQDTFLEEIEKEPPLEYDFGYRRFFNMLITLALILGALFVILWLLKKLMITRSQQINLHSSIKILEQRALSSKSTLYLIEIEKQTLLIAESTNGMTNLIDFPSIDEASSFEKILDKKPV